MDETQRFPVFIIASFAVFFAILRYVTRNRSADVSVARLMWVAAVVVVGGMVFAKVTQNAGWAWWIYYTIPAFVTLALPPVVLRLGGAALWQYLALAALSAPVIHVLFSFLLGWHDYMPFIRVPSLQEILSNGQV